MYEKTTTIVNKTGLHARPASRAKTVTRHWYDEHSCQKAVDTWEGTVERI